MAHIQTAVYANDTNANPVNQHHGVPTTGIHTVEIDHAVPRQTIENPMRMRSTLISPRSMETALMMKNRRIAQVADSRCGFE